MVRRFASLGGSFLAVSIVGLVVSVFYLPQFSVDWATAFGLLFVIMLISSFVSMAMAAPEPQLGRKPIK